MGINRKAIASYLVSLYSSLAVLTEEQFRLEFRRATESLSNPLQLRTIRRDIARIKTILKERASA